MKFGVFLCLLAAAPPAPAQAPDVPIPTPRPKAFVEKVEVRVRSVLVFAFDAKGNPPSPPLKPAEFRISENGTEVEVLDAEPLTTSARRNVPPPAATPTVPEVAPPSGTAQ